MRVLGLDLSGPSNVADTAAVWTDGERCEACIGLGDEALVGLLGELRPAVVGLDAPLSYQPGGGDRAGDRALRKRIVEVGMHSGSVMTPTMTRMAYLTLRGLAVARLVAQVVPSARVVEVHPGAVMALAGADVDVVKQLKASDVARGELVAWLRGQGAAVPDGVEASDHLVAAAAACWGAGRWADGVWSWRREAEPPFHPYDFVA